MKTQFTAFFMSALMAFGFCSYASAQSVNPSFVTPGISSGSATSATGSLIPLLAPSPSQPFMPAHTLSTDIPLSYFDNILPVSSFGVATIGQYTVYALGERMTLPTSTGFVDSVTLTFTAAAGDSIAVLLFPDTLYMDQFHLINILDPNVTPYSAPTWIPASLINGSLVNGTTSLTIHYPHIAVPQNFFVVVLANVNTAQLSITSSFALLSDTKAVIPRTTDNVHSGFLAYVTVNNTLNNTTNVFDSTFTNSQTSQPIYSDWYITSFVQTSEGSVAVGHQNNNELSVFPNPAVSHLSISAPSGIENGTVELRDMLGRVAFQSASFSGESLDVSGLAPGRYEAIVHSTSGVMTSPVIIQR
jgi:hypothetical protein